MNDIRDITISGIDESRPPRLRKEPYIDLYFTLSAQAPPRWCEMFNDRIKSEKFPAKIQTEKGLIIETWVREIDEIETALRILKEGVKQTTQSYLARMAAEAAEAQGRRNNNEATGEQARLNQVIAQLDFDS